MKTNATTDKCWKYLKTLGFTDAGAAGMMGNMYAESACNPSTVEALLIKRYKEEGFLTWPYELYSQKTYDLYLKRFNNGEISEAEFLSPRQYTGKKHQYGYGLCQWTTKTRKKRLLSLAQRRGVSISDLQMQLDLLYTELADSFPTVLKACMTSTSVNEVSDIVLVKFEAPANADSMKGTRREYSQFYFDSYSGKAQTTIVDEFSKYIGVHEYDGIVATIQKWYYGSLVKDKWCATSTSYFAHIAGVLEQIGGKNESVKNMMDATRKLHKSDGRFFEYPNIPVQLKKHDIVFFKREEMSHVAHCWKDCEYTGGGTINVLGGNQSDMICKKDYKQAGIQAVYRPQYKAEDIYMLELKTIREGDSGDDVLLLQEILRARGYTQKSGRPLGLSKKFGPETLRCVKEFQQRVQVEPDGIVGPITWNKLTRS